MIAVNWSHGKACSGSHMGMPAQASQLEADASRFWEQDPDYHEWLDEMERRDDERSTTDR